MTEITEAVERVRETYANCRLMSAPLVPQPVIDIELILSELTRLQEENGQLRLAICGGEDAPGYADSLPLADILGVAANNLGSWREASDRAARLQEEVKGLRDVLRPILRLRIAIAGAITEEPGAHRIRLEDGSFVEGPAADWLLETSKTFLAVTDAAERALQGQQS